ncbi:MAG: hypothetical protein A2751_00215 [Candidatus Doudnabacteria bacterium RIFCSPHIGHO2_01_FULL_46_14]|uniref:Uncharacterized protein n=1 Tax=Candidatus Doudnabacteria bacterium RIFCSPHIGHO2_01_FULL_46_14 TaxID=1817824 RepID=A0A1F5NN11_9BACT|nr:MAG: hypothetical protein A2751_00215 [Candidatus Doudnabacteria bacterium RIFCSPHIGHO2_01_FULL_46_14]
MKRNTLIILALAVAVLIILLFIAANKSDKGSQPVSVSKKDNLDQPYETERVVKQNTEASLSAFPQGFPVEAGAQAGDSYKYVPANSVEQQSTVQYTSNKSLEENGKIFRDYLAAAGFTIVNKLERADKLFYYASKDNNDLSVTISSIDGAVTVSATYLKR